MQPAGEITRPPWRIFLYGSLALSTVAAGLVLRLVPLGLPWWVVKWCGSILWAVMVYFILAAILARRGAATVAWVAAAVATLVELIRLFHAPGLDAFRETLAGKLLLGRVFSWGHFAVYWMAIGLAALADHRWLRCWIPCVTKLKD